MMQRHIWIVWIKNKKDEEGNFRRYAYLPSNSKIKEAYPGLDEWTDLENIIDKMLKVKEKNNCPVTKCKKNTS